MSGIAVEDGTNSEQIAATQEYVQKHKINELFAHFLQLLLYEQPENPRAFLCEEIRKIREEKTSTSLFTERDLETMFDLIDVTKQRWITVQQLRNTCRNLATAAGEGTQSLPPAQEEALAHAGDAEGHVTLEKFKEVLGLQLLTKNMWSE